MPSVGSPTSRIAERSATFNSVTFRAGRPQTGHGSPIDLFLAKNRIRVLPVELFELANLRVLSLRQYCSLSSGPSFVFHLVQHITGNQ